MVEDVRMRDRRVDGAEGCFVGGCERAYWNSRR